MAQQDISVSFSANITQFKQAMSKLGDTVSNTAKSVSDKAKSMADAFKPVSTAITAFGGASVLASNQMAEGVNTFKTKLGASGAELEKYKGIMENVASKGVGSFEEVSGAIVNVTQNMKGLKGKELEDISYQAMQIANVMGSDVSEVTKTAGIMMKNFGISGQEAMDLIAKGYQNGMDFAGDFQDTISEYSVYFDQIGFSANDMFNILAEGAEKGAFNLDKVGDAVKEFGIRSKDGSDSTKEAFKSLGLDADKMTATFAKGGEGAKKAYAEVVTALSNVKDETQRNAIGVALFGTMYEDMEKDVIASTGAIVDHMGDVGGAAKQMADDNKTFGQVLKGAWNDVSVAITPVGERITEIATKAIPPLINMVKKLSSGFTKLSPTMQTVVISLGGLIAIAPILLSAFATVVGFIPNVVKGFQMIGTAFKALRLLFATNPFILIITAVVALVAIIIMNWDTIKKYLQVTWNWIKSTAETVWNAISSFFSTTWNAIVKVAKVIWEGLKLYFTTVFNIYKTIILTVWNTIKTSIEAVWNGIVAVAKVIWNLLKTYFTTTFNVYKTIILTVWNAISSFLKTIWNSIKSVATTIFNILKNTFKTIFTNIKTTITTIWNSIKTTLTTVWNGIKSVATSVWNGIKTSISNAINIAKTVVSTAVNGIKSTISRVFNGIKNTATSVWNGVKNAMTKPVETAKNTIKGAIDKIKGFFSGLSLKFPSIKMPKLPKFSLSGSFSLNPPSVPKLNVSWHQDGGIIKGTNGGTIVGVGENGGDEAILPLSNKSRMKPFAHAVANMMPEKDGGNNGEAVKELIVHVPVQIDGREVAKATVKFSQEELEALERKQNRLKGQK